MSIPSPAIGMSHDIIECGGRRWRTDEPGVGRLMSRPPAADQRDLGAIGLCNIHNCEGDRSAQVGHRDRATAGPTFVGGVELDLRIQTAEALQRLYNQELGGVGKVFTCTVITLVSCSSTYMPRKLRTLDGHRCGR